MLVTARLAVKKGRQARRTLVGRSCCRRAKAANQTCTESVSAELASPGGTPAYDTQPSGPAPPRAVTLEKGVPNTEAGDLMESLLLAALSASLPGLAGLAGDEVAANGAAAASGPLGIARYAARRWAVQASNRPGTGCVEGKIGRSEG